MTPTARSLTYLRHQGWQVAVVESWVPRLNIRRDLWGFGDLLAVHPRDGLFLIVQTTTASHLSNRLTKARKRPELALWLKAGGRFEVHGWERRPKGWQVRVVSVQAEGLTPIAPPRRQRRERQPELFQEIAPEFP